MLDPEYLITPQSLSNMTEIAEIKAIIERSRVLPLNEAQLRRQAVLRMAHTSTSIEGNKLAQFEVGKIYEGQSVRAPAKDVQEVENYLNALKLLEEMSKKKTDLTVEEVLAMHKVVIEGQVEKNKVGKFRPGDVFVLDDLGGGRQMLRFKGPDSKKVPGLMNDLLSWVKRARSEGIHPVLIAGVFHLEF